METLPTPAWVQAVFVCLFIVLIVYVFRFLSKQTKEFQDFIATWTKQRDEQWQGWLDDQREVDRENLANMKQTLTGQTNAITELARIIQELTKKFEAHDEMERAVLNKPREEN